MAIHSVERKKDSMKKRSHCGLAQLGTVKNSNSEIGQETKNFTLSIAPPVVIKKLHTYKNILAHKNTLLIHNTKKL